MVVVKQQQRQSNHMRTLYPIGQNNAPSWFCLIFLPAAPRGGPPGQQQPPGPAQRISQPDIFCWWMGARAMGGHQLAWEPVVNKHPNPGGVSLKQEGY